MTKLTIQKYNEKDFEETKELILGVFKEKAWPIESIIAIDNFQIIFSKPNEIFLVVKDDNDQILGTGGIKEHNKNIALLTKMYVRPSERGKGIGQTLLKKLVEFTITHEYNQVLLRVVKTNQKAISFYKRNKFKKLSQKDISTLSLNTNNDFFEYYALIHN